jgi:hypothetical protein
MWPRSARWQGLLHAASEWNTCAGGNSPFVRNWPFRIMCMPRSSCARPPPRQTGRPPAGAGPAQCHCGRRYPRRLADDDPELPVQRQVGRGTDPDPLNQAADLAPLNLALAHGLIRVAALARCWGGRCGIVRSPTPMWLPRHWCPTGRPIGGICGDRAAGHERPRPGVASDGPVIEWGRQKGWTEAPIASANSFDADSERGF